MRHKRLVICGGHLTPALAVIEELRKRGNYDLYYIGRIHAAEYDRAISLEAQVLTHLKIHFLPIITGRLTREITLSTFLTLAKVSRGIITSIYYLLKVRPDKIISFGGYISLPVCFVGWLMRIPIVASEQTRVLGLANKIIARMAQVLCLAWSDTKGVPSYVKTKVTGIPVRKSILEADIKGFKHPGNPKLPLIYVTGGSLGAMVINRAVGELVANLVEEFRLLHQCGSSKNEIDYRQLKNIKEKLPSHFSKNYMVVKHLQPETIGSILKQATLVVGRAGANTICEVALLAVPAIFIPLPISGGNEQEYNAAILEKEGSAVVIKQKNLTPEVLYGAIKDIISNFSRYKENASKARNLYPTDGAREIAALL